MTTNALSISVAIVFLHLASAYLRFFVFRGGMTADLAVRLWRRLALWSAVHLAFYLLFFSSDGITVFSYKAALMLGWVPFLAIFMVTVRRNPWQHIFVFGMSAIWSFSLHSLSGLVTGFFLDGSAPVFFMTVHAWLCLLLFLLLLPLACRCFGNLQPSTFFFASSPHGRYLASLPLVILVMPLLLSADGELIPSLRERISCLFLPIGFFFLYRASLLAAQQSLEHLDSLRTASRLKARLAFLDEHQRQLLQSHEELSLLRHDLRHNYRLLCAMLEAGETERAVEYIGAQEQQLGVRDEEGTA
jgi:hypothetical protein